MKKISIQLSSPDIGPKEIDEVITVLKSPTLSMGNCLLEFERKFAEYTRSLEGIGMNSGTSGLHASVIASGIKRGDKVITPSFSFISSANCLLYEGAKPVFVDIDQDTMNMDPDLVESLIDSKTKAILPVHAFGMPCEMDKIMEIAESYNLIVIEDACEAIGATWDGHSVGTFGKFGVFAFYPNKQMTTGEGGMVVTNNRKCAEILRSLRNQGRDNNGTWLKHIRLGYNYRMDEMSAALGKVQITRIGELLQRRENVARMYRSRLSRIKDIILPMEKPRNGKRSWFVYVIRFAKKYDRKHILLELEKNGIPTRPYFVPIHLQPFYKKKFGFSNGDLPVTESVAKTTLALPFHNNITKEQINYIGDILENVIDTQ